MNPLKNGMDWNNLKFSEFSFPLKAIFHLCHYVTVPVLTDREKMVFLSFLCNTVKLGFLYDKKDRRYMQLLRIQVNWFYLMSKRANNDYGETLFSKQKYCFLLVVIG